MNDALQAEKYRMIIEKAKAANRRHLQTEKGKAKGRIASYNFYNSHNIDDDFLQKKQPSFTTPTMNPIASIDKPKLKRGITGK